MRPKEIPAELAGRPFTRREALELGMTPKMLRGARIHTLYRGVHCLSADLADSMLLPAARRALPERAHLTGISLIRELGLDYGAPTPLRFVIQGDHHLAIPGIFLHRTVELPPTDALGVVPYAAYVSYCSLARAIDAIKVGDWLVHHGHMDLATLTGFAVAQPWRDGAQEALWVSGHLSTASWSLKESETRALLNFAGLPPDEQNQGLEIPSAEVIGDLLYEAWRTVVEYEGHHHQEDRGQYVRDIDRYALMRRHGYRYVQITAEQLKRPQRMVRAVHAELCAAGYDGPPPLFGEQWRALFARLSSLVGPRDRSGR
jgi:hypothetical protein